MWVLKSGCNLGPVPWAMRSGRGRFETPSANAQVTRSPTEGEGFTEDQTQSSLIEFIDSWP